MRENFSIQDKKDYYTKRANDSSLSESKQAYASGFLQTVDSKDPAAVERVATNRYAKRKSEGSMSRKEHAKYRGNIAGARAHRPKKKSNFFFRKKK